MSKAVSANRQMKSEMKNVINDISKKMGVSSSDITGNSRVESVTTARAVAMYILREKGYTFSDIGDTFNRHHSTVINAYNKIKEIMEDDEQFRGYIDGYLGREGKSPTPTLCDTCGQQMSMYS